MGDNPEGEIGSEAVPQDDRPLIAQLGGDDPKTMLQVVAPGAFGRIPQLAGQ